MRIIRACRDEGIETVAVYADSDRDAMFVRMADQAHALGGDKPADTYLDGAKIIAIDIYRNGTIEQADFGLVIRPGSDGALACGGRAR